MSKCCSIDSVIPTEIKTLQVNPDSIIQCSTIELELTIELPLEGVETFIITFAQHDQIICTKIINYSEAKIINEKTLVVILTTADTALFSIYYPLEVQVRLQYCTALMVNDTLIGNSVVNSEEFKNKYLYANDILVGNAKESSDSSDSSSSEEENKILYTTIDYIEVTKALLYII